MSWFSVFSSRVHGLFKRQSAERDLDDELRFHIEMRIEENRRAGMPVDEARLAAIRDFGGIESTKEQYREARSLFWLETSWRDIRYAWRSLRKDWGFSTVSVVSLMLGIGGNAAIFSVMDTVLVKSLPVRSPEQLRFLMKTGGRSPVDYFSVPFYQQIESHNELFTGMLAFFDGAGSLQISADLARPGNSSEMVHAQLVSDNYFSLLGLNPIVGRTFGSDDHAVPDNNPVAVISYSYWHSHFAGGKSCVGTKIFLNGAPFTVIGVTPSEFSGLTPGAPPDITVRLMMQSRIWLDPGSSIVDNAKFGWLRLMVRLTPGLTQQRVQSGLTAISRQIDASLLGEPAARESRAQMELTPGARGLDSLRSRFSQPLHVLMGLVAFVLLVACANVAALMLARALSRQREIGTRLALGATRSRLIRQLLAESFMIAAIGSTLGLLFACGAGELLLRALAQSPVPIKLNFAVNQRLLLFTFALAVATTLLSGIIPAAQATNPSIVRSLSGTGTFVSLFRQGRGRFPLGKLLVLFQLALSLVLLVAAGLFITSLNNLRGLKAGFDPDNLLLATINPAMVGYHEPQLNNAYKDLLGRIREIPGVVSATMLSHSLVTPGVDDSGFSVPGRTVHPGEPRGVNLNMVGPEFFETMRIPILLGRGITVEDDERSPFVAVITQSLARQYFSGHDPIGKYASVGGPPLEIIGVTEDVKYNSLHDETSRVVYLPYRQRPSWHPPIDQITFVARTKQRNPDAIMSALRHAITEFDQALPIASLTTARTQIMDSLVQERLLAWLAGGFGTLGLALACVGLVGTMTHSVIRRTSEIGIRMAVGAKRRQVVLVFIREATVLCLAGSLLGVGLAWASARLASNLLFAIKPTDPVTMAASALLLIIVAVGAALLPSWRASRVDPIRALGSN